ncbi:hypothetical protein Poli38472_006599 [Pythium oligandrum]|uniref:Ricin B lectin domain-containing protein n=1 Tax=Pythium oligandrum TaxID=41045 RepID=A0A8K1C4V9_PYTOL|nr:hypothetical protein Poli38472_006599 [Pythium oligandrum]|eukprot:TMW56589.1 hypothetical protein Poli38472_006599 [Pythium oligandrum]
MKLSVVFTAVASLVMVATTQAADSVPFQVHPKSASNICVHYFGKKANYYGVTWECDNLSYQKFVYDKSAKSLKLAANTNVCWALNQENYLQLSICDPTDNRQMLVFRRIGSSNGLIIQVDEYANSCVDANRRNIKVNDCSSAYTTTTPGQIFQVEGISPDLIVTPPPGPVGPPVVPPVVPDPPTPDLTDCSNP